MRFADAMTILGLEPGASLEDARTAFRHLAKINHPDHAGTVKKDRDQAEARMKEINRAYHELRLVLKSKSHEDPPRPKPEQPRSGVNDGQKFQFRTGEWLKKMFRSRPGKPEPALSDEPKSGRKRTRKAQFSSELKRAADRKRSGSAFCGRGREGGGSSKGTVDYYTVYSTMRRRMTAGRKKYRPSGCPVEEISPVSRINPVEREV